MPGGDYVSDVRGIDPLAPSYLEKNKRNPNAAADQAARDKTKKYKNLLSDCNVKFEPFVFDLLGGLHKSAVRLLKTRRQELHRHLDG